MKPGMKKRTVPFGYCFENGRIIINPAEEKILCRIRHEYLSGYSLLQIARGLMADSVEFAAGCTVWNKARIMRMIDDDRYLGNETYPRIFDRETMARLRTKKAACNTQADIDRSSGIYQLRVPVLCQSCGAAMQRTQSRNCKCRQWWVCSTCRAKVELSDHVLLQQITKLLNDMIANPERLLTDPAAPEPSPERHRTDNNIAQAPEEADGERLWERLLQRLTLLYHAIGNESYTAWKLKECFAQQELLEEFSPELTRRTVRQICLSQDGTISITLRNGQEIGKEKSHADNTTST